MAISLDIISNPPQGIDLGFFMIRYYSLMFVIAFSLGYYLMKKIFIREGESLEKLDSIFIWTAVATLIGARLGQVFFYDWAYFSEHPLEILLPFKFTDDGMKFTGFSGLASHGAAIGVIIAMYFFSKKVMKRPILWVLDRVVITVASGGIFVRIGNFFNSEIFGKPTESGHFYAVKFVRDDEFWKTHDPIAVTGAANETQAYHMIATDPKFSNILSQIPFRHPAQLYEAFLYIFVFAILYYMYWKTDARKKEGLIFGVFLILLWSVRFLVEYVKASQDGFGEKTASIQGILSTGQWLSIPFIIAGFFLVFWSNRKKEATT